MNIEQVRECALSLPGVTEDMPFGDDHVVFRIEGKISPERNEELRAQYSAITPAWHWNKKHWSDIYYARDLSDTQLSGWIAESYRLMVQKLPQAVRSRYEGNY